MLRMRGKFPLCAATSRCWHELAAIGIGSPTDENRANRVGHAVPRPREQLRRKTLQHDRARIALPVRYHHFHRYSAEFGVGRHERINLAGLGV